jgi:uncharacterized protein YgiM (DUF1202 family)
MTIRSTHMSGAVLVRAAVVVACCACASYAASAVLSGIDIVGGEKGVALTLRADSPFPLKSDQKQLPGNPGRELISLHCSGIIYGLADFEFTTFPDGCPVAKIAVRESPAGNSIDLAITLAQSSSGPLALRQRDAKWIMLLSKQKSPDFSWNSSATAAPTQSAATKKPVKAEPGASRLADISLLVRDNVEQLTFSFDGPTAMKCKRDQDKIVLLFVNAISGIPVTSVSPPGDPGTVIDLKQIAHGGTLWLGATVSMPASVLENALIQTFSDKLVIYSVLDSVARLFFWSAAGGHSMQYAFAELPRFKVDMEGMKEKAVTDLSDEIQKTRTFAVREESVRPTAGKSIIPAASAVSQPAPVAERIAPVIRRFVVTKDNVNLRSDPSADGAVLERLSAGAVVSFLLKNNGWTKVRSVDTVGWISETMLVDSARASKAIIDNIEKTVRARQAREDAVREKAAREAAAREKSAQEKLAKQNLAAERNAHNKAATEAKVSSVRDSTVRYAAVQDSFQTVKSLQARKPVEYHVYGRDPFLSLSGDEENKVRNVEDLALVGILYDQADRIALFETQKGREKAIALRENDPVQNGYVLRIQPDKVLFLLNELGISRTYALKLSKDKEN